MADFGVGKSLYSELRTTVGPYLPDFLMRQRWFGGKAREIGAVELLDVIPIHKDSLETFLLIVKVMYADGADECYAMPVLRAEPVADPVADPSTLIFPTDSASGQIVLIDGLRNEAFLRTLLELIRERAVVSGEKGELRAFQTTAYSRLNPELADELHPRPVRAEQSNTSIIYGNRLILKFFRRIQEGTNPDLEIGQFLTEKTSFASVPPLAGSLRYDTQDGRQMAQGMLQAFVPNEGDAWTFTLRALDQFYDLMAERAEREVPTADSAGGSGNEAIRVPDYARGTVEPYLAAAQLLGQRTAEMHLALASEPSDPAFVPEPFTMEFQRHLEEMSLGLMNRAFSLLRDNSSNLPEAWRSNGERLARREQEIADRFHNALSRPIRAMRTRIHGDYHLGQVLRTGSDFVIIDFEGEPARSIAERRTKRSPLQDVAGMLRSFHYAAFAPLLGESRMHADKAKKISVWAEPWNTWVASRFLGKYFEMARGAAYLPQSKEEMQAVLELHLLEKAIYELWYELNNRPAWVGIPLQGIWKILAT
jgi:trehalose synthase-fused probable maltokinase